jgi:hypothetical protein
VRVGCVTSSLVNAIFNGARNKCGSESMNFLVRRAASASAVRMSASLRFVASPLVSPFFVYPPNRVAHDLLLSSTAFSFAFEYNTCVLCSAGVGMRTGTTITCQSTMVTFSGKKCVVFPPRLLRHLSCALIIVRLQPGKPRKSEGWEKIYVAAFGAGALSTYLPLVVIFLFFQHMNGLFGNLCLNDLQLP